MELILKSIGNVFEFTAKYDSYEQFEADKICCHAVTYNIQCIGVILSPSETEVIFYWRKTRRRRRNKKEIPQSEYLS